MLDSQWLADILTPNIILPSKKSLPIAKSIGIVKSTIDNVGLNYLNWYDRYIRVNLFTARFLLKTSYSVERIIILPSTCHKIGTNWYLVVFFDIMAAKNYHHEDTIKYDLRTFRIRKKSSPDHTVENPEMLTAKRFVFARQTFVVQ